MVLGVNEKGLDKESLCAMSELIQQPKARSSLLADADTNLALLSVRVMPTHTKQ